MGFWVNLKLTWNLLWNPQSHWSQNLERSEGYTIVVCASCGFQKYTREWHQPGGSPPVNRNLWKVGGQRVIWAIPVTPSRHTYFKLQPQFTTDGCTEAVHLLCTNKYTQIGGNRSCSVPQLVALVTWTSINRPCSHGLRGGGELM